jgi:hypothetical protein
VCVAAVRPFVVVTPLFGGVVPPLLRILQMSPVNSPPKAWEFFTLKAVVWADVALFAKDDVSECWVVSKK